MDLGKLFISIILVVLFYLLFGHESISKLREKGMTISHSENKPQNIKSPGNVHLYMSLDHFEIMFEFFLDVRNICWPFVCRLFIRIRREMYEKEFYRGF